mgnify:CR=1 FL=1
MSLGRALARNLHGLGLAVVRVHRRTFNSSQNLPVIQKHTETFFDRRILIALLINGDKVEHTLTYFTFELLYNVLVAAPFLDRDEQSAKVDLLSCFVIHTLL